MRRRWLACSAGGRKERGNSSAASRASWRAEVELSGVKKLGGKLALKSSSLEEGVEVVGSAGRV